MEKPFELRFLEAKQLLINTIDQMSQECRLPFVVIQSLVYDVARQVDTAAKDEMSIVNKNYYSSLQEKAEETVEDISTGEE